MPHIVDNVPIKNTLYRTKSRVVVLEYSSRYWVVILFAQHGIKRNFTQTKCQVECIKNLT